MAKAKKKKIKKSVEEASAKFTFTTRDNSDKLKLDGPVEGNKASEVVFRVLQAGDIPKGIRLQFAPSYNAHFINKKGKNACGASEVKNLLVVNGIADELEASGVKGIINPSKVKPYKAIKLESFTGAEISNLVSKISMILGFTGKTKAKKAEKATTEEVSSPAPA